MNHNLQGKMIAILVADGFEQSELLLPRRALEEAGASTHVISPDGGIVRACDKDDYGDEFPVDRELSEVDSSEYDALLLPGGLKSPDTLRTIPGAVDFVRAFFDQGKPVAAICHGPQLLIEAGVVRGRTLTSCPSLRTDLINAGAIWVDKSVETDHGLITSRRPSDLPDFNAKIIEEFAEGYHEAQKERVAMSEK
ncbi:MAG TPA: type 1 glutamine amidotransferase domain-containing protein [Candidatus Methylacidiphilales bacterium]|nr:type 1 glutamine amidotransferase domain-containing protein [Candidatus Methylacidiphilales bacterium]